MVSFRKKVPVTGTLGDDVTVERNPATYSGEVTETTARTNNSNSSQSDLASVMKDDDSQISIPKESTKKSSKSRSIKKVALYIIFIILLISVVSFSITVVRTFRNKESKVDLNDKTGEIVWWGLEDPRIYEDVINLYQQSNPEAKIQYIQQPPGQYVRRLNNALKAGSGPDIFSFHNSWAESYSPYISLISHEVYSIEDFESVYYPVVIADLKTDSGLYGLPLEYDGLTMYVNDDIFRASGRETPERWDELRPLAIDMTQRDSNGLIIQSGIAMGITDNVDYWQDLIALLMYQNGVDPAKPVGPSAQVVFDFYNSFASARVWDSSFPASTTAFAQGDSAMLFGTSKSAREINTSQPRVNYKTITVPQVRKDDRFSEDVGYSTYWVEGVSSGSPEKGLAYDFLRFASDPRNLQNMSEKSEEVFGVGRVYPRSDMADLQLNDPILGAVIELAPVSQSWYLADKTYDEPDGINTQVSTIYEEMLQNSSSLGVVDALANQLVTSLTQVLNFFANPTE